MIGLSKSEQLKKNGTLKEKPFKSKAYLEWFHNQNFGCMVCGNKKGYAINIEANHVKEYSSDPRDDMYILPLCEFHHKYSDYLSPHGAPKKWRKTYPIEVQKEMALKTFEEWQSEKN